RVHRAELVLAVWRLVVGLLGWRRCAPPGRERDDTGMAGLFEAVVLAAETVGGPPGGGLDHDGHVTLEHDLDVHVHAMTLPERDRQVSRRTRDLRVGRASRRPSRLLGEG